MNIQKGFTLVELLIVIAILGILAAVTVAVVNPTQMLAQARDANRMADIVTLRNSLNIYIVSVAAPDLNGAFPNTECAAGLATLGYIHTGAPPNGSFNMGRAAVTATQQGSRAVNGTGWLPVAFTDTPGGSPLAILPIDPVDGGNFRYRYACDQASLTYELNVLFESTRYIELHHARDGGNNRYVFELGTAPGLGF